MVFSNSLQVFDVGDDTKFGRAPKLGGHWLFQMLARVVASPNRQHDVRVFKCGFWPNCFALSLCDFNRIVIVDAAIFVYLPRRLMVITSKIGGRCRSSSSPAIYQIRFNKPLQVLTPAKFRLLVWDLIAARNDMSL